MEAEWEWQPRAPSLLLPGVVDTTDHAESVPTVRLTPPRAHLPGPLRVCRSLPSFQARPLHPREMPPASLLPTRSSGPSCEQLIPSSEGSGSPQRTAGNVSETLWVTSLWVGGTDSGFWWGGDSPHHKNYAAPNVDGAVEKPWDEDGGTDQGLFLGTIFL